MLARKVIRISAEDSPNVRWARKEIAAGRKPSGRVLIPGVLEFWELLFRRKTWDAKRQAIGLDATFYTGPELKLFPPQWLEAAATRARDLVGKPRVGGGRRTLGIDPAEGGDRSAFAVSDMLGLIHLESLKTPDTTLVVDHAMDLMYRYQIEPEDVIFDRGGGGGPHAHRMRKAGMQVRTVAFGDSISMEPKRGMRFFSEKVENKEDRYVYKNRRAQMFGEMSIVIDPSGIGPEDIKLWGIPGPEVAPVYAELHRQLKVFPRNYDEEGRMFLPPKNPKPGDDENARKKTLFSMLGCSPDEADAVVLSLHGLLHELPCSTVVVGG